MSDYEKALQVVVEKAKKYDQLLMMNGTDTLTCSFCGRDQEEVEKLIAGPRVYICDECVELCVEIIEESEEC